MLLRSAAAARDSHDYAAAVSSYQTLHAQNPDDMDIVLGLARNLRYLGRLNEARAVLTEAVEKAPANGLLVAELGKIALAEGDTAEAVKLLNKAIELDPKSWQTHSSLGIAYDFLGRSEDARRSYETALALSPENAAVLNNLALSRTLAGDLEGGVSTLSAIADRPGVTAQIRQNLALLYALRGNIGETEALARRDLPNDIAENNISYYRLLNPGHPGITGDEASPDTAPAPPAVHPLRRGTIR